MADVFISYASEDREQARVLASLLEANGYSVWWDTSLLSGEKFRQSIMKELGRSRVTIVIWTEHSVKSDWVQSEAGRAHANQKLIPVKAKSLSYEDLPLPFDNLHTEDVADHEKILAAIVSQLEKPEQEASFFSRFTGHARYELLTWFGVVGGAITLFSNAHSLFRLSAWANWVIENWVSWVGVFWNSVSNALSLQIPPPLQLDLTFMVFIILVAAGTRFSRGKGESGPDDTPSSLRSFFGWHTLFAFLLLCAIVVVNELLGMAMNAMGMNIALRFLIVILVLFGEFYLFVVLLLRSWPVRYARRTAVYLAVIAIGYYLTSYAINPKLIIQDAELLWISTVIVTIGSIIAMLVAVPSKFPNRLRSIIVVLLLLVVANEIGKAGFDLTPPKQSSHLHGHQAAEVQPFQRKSER